MKNDYLITIDTVQTTDAGDDSFSLSTFGEYDYSSEASYTIYVESTLDGRKVGEGTAKYVRMANEAAERREARRAGRNV